MPSSALSPMPMPSSDWLPRMRGWLRGAAIMYVLLLTFGSLAPDPLAWIRTKRTGPKSTWPPYLAWIENDKVQHAAAYGGLTVLILGSTTLTPAGIALLGAVHGGVIEILQRWSPPRTSDILDWLADVVGIGAVLVLHFFLFRRRLD